MLGVQVRERDRVAQRRRRLAGGDHADLLVRACEEDLGAFAGGAALLGGQARDDDARFTASERVLAHEVRFLLGKRAAHACFHRGDLGGQLVAVQRHRGFQAQRVARRQAARGAGADDGVPHLLRVIACAEQLEAVLAGVAGAGDEGFHAVEGHPRAGVVGQGGGVVAKQRLQHLERTRALDRNQRERFRIVGQLYVEVALAGLKRGPHGGGVRGVGHDHEVVLAEAVGDQVVQDAAVLGDDHGVLRLAVFQRGEVGDEGVVQKRGGVGALDGDLAHVGQVEDAHVVADGAVLLQLRAVLQRHLPAAEVGETGAELLVGGMQRGLWHWWFSFKTQFRCQTLPAAGRRTGGCGRRRLRRCDAPAGSTSRAPARQPGRRPSRG